MDYLLGQIILFPYGFVPMGFMLCNGTILTIQQNTALFSLLGNKFGGNGTTTFALPNLANTSATPGMEYYIATQGIYPTRD
jgi:microcystin-dependent protein